MAKSSSSGNYGGSTNSYAGKTSSPLAYGANTKGSYKSPTQGYNLSQTPENNGYHALAKMMYTYLKSDAMALQKYAQKDQGGKQGELQGLMQGYQGQPILMMIMPANYGGQAPVPGMIPGSQGVLGNITSGIYQWDEQAKRIKEGVDNFQKIHGVPHEIAARYAMDISTLGQMGYSGNPHEFLNGFYQSQAKQDPNNQIYSQLEKMASNYQSKEASQEKKAA